MTDQPARGRLYLRYEDVSQEGIIRLETLTASLGVVWRASLVQSPLVDACRREAIIPILTELEITGAPGPFGIESGIETTGRFELAHVAGEGGEPQRLLLDLVTELHGKIGRTNLPPPPNAGERAFAGRVFARHVFTRPFAAPGERRVLALPVPDDDGDRVPAKRADWEDPEVFGGLPPGATILAEPARDPAEIAVGFLHTDSNQHVNSLVYPRLFEEAALRRMRAVGRPTTVHARAMRMGFRKPTFAGEALRVEVALYEHEGSLGAAGAFYGADEPATARPRVFIRARYA
jgi:hypothetical protein